ncbi:Asp-tRNA(Asn)/Glu-tRNA(Gln) amidotransferase GatCAB subunit C [Roseococcus sp. SYP-B2431]|uniref:molybdopterin guanine dinucleotide-containing S/N-oxide reductase n=1 Tax=Roseococcus sp. SYP-B2431 TaxID=2496640 RepID=UPI00103FCC80|nr:molybdopterin guanine dinucleotide-containing S/N-oxide reductase [Roseococcus sp. SYP-B2431]TCH97096.1 Asp-tRNA(Asn)/Glu-tRNA(Gln) amidotransferase GatCAB subunit C [Roseococcus sp. SYP-B2431]
MPEAPPFLPHSSHWGNFTARWHEGRLELRPHPGDPDPSPILGNMEAALRHPARIARPMVRRGWLERGPGPSDMRGRDELVPMEWDQVLDLLAAELKRVKERHGPQSVFGGSYGWSSAGRFHHAQSQVHRFLNVALGGYVRSVNSYSAGASGVILPRIVGPMETISRRNVTWEAIAEHSEIVLSFGGMALKNSAVASGGISRHIERGCMRAARERGAEFVLVGPLRDDLPAEAGAEWLPIRPNTDTALMLALTHTLVAEGLHDAAFLARYTDGWEVFQPYLMGGTDGQPKDAAWAAAITDVPAETIVALARRLAGRRSLIAVAHSLQRAEFGEQPVWMGLVLAAALGQLGLPGGGYHYSLGALGHTGRRNVKTPVAALNQGRNSVREFIPVARITDVLLNPGGRFDYDGKEYAYADIRLVYWAGGNPFHHHQDLNRLRRGFANVDTLVVHESAWTATARHADIVLPATVTMEREDIGAEPTDPLIVPMHRIAAPYGEARDDYAIFSALAERLGCGDAFTEGRGVREWLAFLYEPAREALEKLGQPAPDFETLWRDGPLEIPFAPDDGGMLRAFREDPEANALHTESGRIQVFSPVIASFGYSDCPGHPTWLEPVDVPNAETPLRLIANQPATKLHSQLDFGATSQGAKRRGREVARLHPDDAAARGIAEGDILRLFNARGACLATAHLTTDVAPGIVNLPTGAWYDPDDAASDTPLCVHGNPNVLTRDIGTSRLAQGCTGQLTSIEVERFDGNLPPIRAYDPPGSQALAAE